MKRGGGVHTVPSPKGGWMNELNGRVVSHAPTKEQAVASGRGIARRLRVEHTIHKLDGQIGEKNSYGRDSYPPKG